MERDQPSKCGNNRFAVLSDLKDMDDEHGGGRHADGDAGTSDKGVDGDTDAEQVAAVEKMVTLLKNTCEELEGASTVGINMRENVTGEA